MTMTSDQQKLMAVLAVGGVCVALILGLGCNVMHPDLRESRALIAIGGFMCIVFSLSLLSVSRPQAGLKHYKQRQWMSAMLLPIAMATTIAAGYLWMLLQQMHSWPATDAEVTAVDYKVVTGKRSTSYFPIVTAKYEFNGAELQSSTTSPCDRTVKLASRGGKENDFTPGDHISVFVNPVHPTEFVLEHDSDSFTSNLLLFGGLASLVSLPLLALSYCRYTRLCETTPTRRSVVQRI